MKPPKFNLPHELYVRTVGLITTSNHERNFSPILLRQIKIRNDVDFYKTESTGLNELQLSEIYYNTDIEANEFIKSYLEKSLDRARKELENCPDYEQACYWFPSIESDCNMSDPNAFSINACDEEFYEFSIQDFYEDDVGRIPRLIIFLTEEGYKTQKKAYEKLVQYLENQISRINKLIELRKDE